MLKRSGTITALCGIPSSILEIFERIVLERTEKWRSLRYDLVSKYKYGGKHALILWRSVITISIGVGTISNN